MCLSWGYGYLLWLSSTIQSVNPDTSLLRLNRYHFPRPLFLLNTQTLCRSLQRVAQPRVPSASSPMAVMKSPLSSPPTSRLTRHSFFPSRSLPYRVCLKPSSNPGRAGSVRACEANVRSDGAPVSMGVGSPASSAIDFLTLCHRLKVLSWFIGFVYSWSVLCFVLLEWLFMGFIRRNILISLLRWLIHYRCLVIGPEPGDCMPVHFTSSNSGIWDLRISNYGNF